ERRRAATRVDPPQVHGRHELGRSHGIPPKQNEGNAQQRRIPHFHEWIKHSKPLTKKRLPEKAAAFFYFENRQVRTNFGKIGSGSTRKVISIPTQSTPAAHSNPWQV